MERLAYIIADFFIRKKLIPDDQREVCRYGYEVILSTIVGTILVFSISMAMGKLDAGIVFLLVFCVARRYCGGYHADTYLRCNAMLVLVVVAYFGLIQVLEISSTTGFIIDVVIYLLFMACVVSYAPLDNVNKQLTERQQKKYRFISLILGLVFGIAAAILYICRCEYAIMIIVALFIVTILMVIQVKRRDKDECNTEFNG